MQPQRRYEQYMGASNLSPSEELGLDIVDAWYLERRAPILLLELAISEADRHRGSGLFEWAMRWFREVRGSRSLVS